MDISISWKIVGIDLVLFTSILPSKKTYLVSLINRLSIIWEKYCIQVYKYDGIGSIPHFSSVESEKKNPRTSVFSPI